MKSLRIMRFAAVAVSVLAASVTGSAQKYQNGLIDKTVAVVGNETIMLSDVEEEINGLLTYDRRVLKADGDTIRAVNRKVHF